MILPKYDTIGKDYNRTRKADPYLTEWLYTLLHPVSDGVYLDIGCGTGNYTRALYQKGLRFIGIDPSEKMLQKAMASETNIDWRCGTAEQTGLDSKSIAGIIAILTLHHWPDLEKGFRELGRVLKPNAKLVVFTSTPEQMEGCWLYHYFPGMMDRSKRQMPAYEVVKAALETAGITDIRADRYDVQPDLQDLFLYSGKYRPEFYLQSEIRENISSFSSLADEQEVEEGLLRLEQDIVSGKINKVMASFASDKGDYLFVSGVKTNR